MKNKVFKTINLGNVELDLIIREDFTRRDEALEFDSNNLNDSSYQFISIFIRHFGRGIIIPISTIPIILNKKGLSNEMFDFGYDETSNSWVSSDFRDDFQTKVDYLEGLSFFYQYFQAYIEYIETLGKEYTELNWYKNLRESFPQIKKLYKKLSNSNE